MRGTTLILLRPMQEKMIYVILVQKSFCFVRTYPYVYFRQPIIYGEGNNVPDSEPLIVGINFFIGAYQQSNN